MSTLRLPTRLLLGLAAGLLVLGAGCGSRPAAIVNGTKITEADLTQQLRRAYGPQTLSTLIDQQIIQDAFKAAELTLTQEDINAAIEGQFGNYQQFQQMATQQGIDPEDYIERVVKPPLMLEKLATKDVEVNDQVLKEFYTQNKSRYDQPEMINVSVVATSTKADAEKALAALKGGADFPTVVRQYSIDPRSRESGGQMPPMPVNQAPEEIVAAVKGLKDGEHSGAKQMQSLWMIVKLDKRTPAQKFTFDQVKSKVEKDYRGSKLTQETMVALRDKLRREARVAVVDAEFQMLNEEYRSAEVPEFGAEGLTPAASGTPAAAPDDSPPAPATPSEGGQ